MENQKVQDLPKTESVADLEKDGYKPSFTQRDVCKFLGISVPRLAYWEKQGLFKPSQKRSRSNKFRLYTAVEVNELRFVKRLIDGGFNPEQINVMLSKLSRPYNYDLDRMRWDFIGKQWSPDIILYNEQTGETIHVEIKRGNSSSVKEEQHRNILLNAYEQRGFVLMKGSLNIDDR